MERKKEKQKPTYESTQEPVGPQKNMNNPRMWTWLSFASVVTSTLLVRVHSVVGFGRQLYAFVRFLRSGLLRYRICYNIQDGGIIDSSAERI